MSMPKEEIISMVLEMYDARKEAKEYLEFYANPDEDGKLDDYKKIIIEEFYPRRANSFANTRFSVCRKAVSDSPWRRCNSASILSKVPLSKTINNQSHDRRGRFQTCPQ